MSTYTLFFDETGNFSGEHSLVAGFAIKSKKTLDGEKSLPQIQKMLLNNFIDAVKGTVKEVRCSKEISCEGKNQILDYEFCHCSKNGAELIELREFIQPKLLFKLLYSLKSLEGKCYGGNKIESVSIVIFKRGIEVDVFEIGPVRCVLNSENYLMTLAKGFIQFWMQKYQQDYKTNFRIYPSKRNIGDQYFTDTYGDEKKLGSITVSSYVKYLDKVAGSELYDNDLKDFHKILQLAVYDKPADISDSSNTDREKCRYEDYNRDLVGIVAKEEKTDADVESILKVLGHDACSTRNSIQIYFPNISLLQPRPDLSYKYKPNIGLDGNIGCNDVFTVYCDYICNSLRYSKYWTQTKTGNQENNNYDKAFEVFEGEIDIFDAFPTAKYDDVYFHDFITNKKVYELLNSLIITPDLLRSYKHRRNEYVVEYKKLMTGRYSKLIEETKQLYLDLDAQEQQAVLNQLVMKFREKLQEYGKAQINELVLTHILNFFQSERILLVCDPWIKEYLIDFKIFKLKALLNQNKLKDACLLTADISKSMEAADNMRTVYKRHRNKLFSILKFNLFFMLSQHKKCMAEIEKFLKGFYSDDIDEEIGKAINIKFASLIAMGKELDKGKSDKCFKDAERALKQFAGLPSYTHARTYQNLAQLSIMANQYENAFSNLCLSILRAKGISNSDLVIGSGAANTSYDELFGKELSSFSSDENLLNRRLSVIMSLLHDKKGNIDKTLKFNYIVFLDLLIKSEGFRCAFKGWKKSHKEQRIYTQCASEALYPDCSIYLKYAELISVIAEEKELLCDYFDIKAVTQNTEIKNNDFKKVFIRKAIQLFENDEAFTKEDSQILSRKLLYISALTRNVLVLIENGDDYSVEIDKLKCTLDDYNQQVDKFNDDISKLAAEFQFANPLAKIILGNGRNYDALIRKLNNIVNAVQL